MYQSRITAKSQTTVPREVRRALRAGPGDALIWRIEGDHVVLRVSAGDSGDDSEVNYFATFTEWASEADCKAFDHL